MVRKSFCSACILILVFQAVSAQAVRRGDVLSVRKAQLFVVEEGELGLREVRLTLDGAGLVVTDRDSGEVLQQLPYSEIEKIAFSEAALPRSDIRSGFHVGTILIVAAIAAAVVVTLLLVNKAMPFNGGGKQPLLKVEASTGQVFLVLDKRSVRPVLFDLEAGTGLNVEPIW